MSPKLVMIGYWYFIRRILHLYNNSNNNNNINHKVIPGKLNSTFCFQNVLEVSWPVSPFVVSGIFWKKDMVHLNVKLKINKEKNHSEWLIKYWKIVFRKCTYLEIELNWRTFLQLYLYFISMLCSSYICSKIMFKIVTNIAL